MLENREGKRVPDVTFRVRQEGAWMDVTTADLFASKRVVAFALPGAFTPTCSSRHVPRYNELTPLFKQDGVDDILCISVNDTFVMNAWKEDQAADQITVVPDGNGEFTKGMGMLVDKSDLGFGKRSWRYSMLVEDGVIQKMFIEPEVEGDPFEVSDADTMLAYINPEAKLQEPITLFTLPTCPYCARAKRLLQEANLRYEEIQIAGSITRSTLRAMTGNDTVPQIFVAGKYLGDDDTLAQYLADRG